MYHVLKIRPNKVTFTNDWKVEFIFANLQRHVMWFLQCGKQQLLYLLWQRCAVEARHLVDWAEKIFVA